HWGDILIWTPQPVKTFYAPLDPTNDPSTNYTSYRFNSNAFPAYVNPRLSSSFQDGTSNTIALMESYAKQNYGGTPVYYAYNQTANNWGVGSSVQPWNTPPFTVGTPPSQVGWGTLNAFSAGGLQVSMADGSVKTVAPGVSQWTFYYASTPAG